MKFRWGRTEPTFEPLWAWSSSFNILRSAPTILRGKQPWRLTNFPSKWRDPVSGNEVIYPKKALSLPPTYDWANRVENTTRPVWSDVIVKHPEVANGWVGEGLKEMRLLLSGTPMILEGLLRVMRARPEHIEMKHTVGPIRHWLEKAQTHVNVGRIPILRPETQAGLLDKAKQYEIERYGRLLQPEPEKESREPRGLFDGPQFRRLQLEARSIRTDSERLSARSSR